MTSPMPANPSELCDGLSIAHFIADAPDFSGHMIRQTTKKTMSRPLSSSGTSTPPCEGHPLIRAVDSEAENLVLYCLGVYLGHRLSTTITDQGSLKLQTTIEKGEDIETKLDGGPASVP